jgi:hypothetical protein
MDWLTAMMLDSSTFWEALSRSYHQREMKNMRMPIKESTLIPEAKFILE